MVGGRGRGVGSGVIRKTACGGGLSSVIDAASERVGAVEFLGCSGRVAAEVV